MEPSPEALLGLPVLTPQGVRVGTVVDVGVYNRHQPKFLLVRPAEPSGSVSLVRVEIRDVGVEPEAVRLAAPLLPGSLPA